MMEFLNLIVEKIFSVFPKVWRWIRYQWFKLFVNKTPYTKKEAKQIAYGVLSGHIDNAISFRNIDERRPYILVEVRSSVEDHDYKFVLLKKMGNTFIQDWEFERVLLVTDYEIVDIQKNGYHNFAFIEQSAGSGADTKILNIVDLINKRHIKIIEHIDHTSPKNPHSPEVTFEPNDIDKKQLPKIEEYAASKGLFNQNKVDFSKPEHAIQNWHRMNGEISEGEVKLRFYSGEPVYGASISDTLDFEHIKWTAYFKGPLFGYLKNEDKHFVAYSPSWTYNWPKRLKGTPKKVHFEIHSGEVKLTFELDGKSGRLTN
ncbi:MAG TPA: hypothetical protein VF181_00895 [Balneolaceae bacterium]